MADIFSIPVDQVSINDIQALIDSKTTESEQIEFKEGLSTRGQSPDQWITGKNAIGNRAKDSILKEVVAFANTYGGILLLGVRESDKKPPVAIKIVPIPRCVELAERLKLIFRDRVEPQLPRLEIHAIQIADENGIVIIRTGRSRLAPHRVTQTLICPIRRADRCEVMSMREIQDMTLNLSRGIEWLEKRLSSRSKRFPQEFQCLRNPEEAFGIRLSAAPISNDIQIDSLFEKGRIIDLLNMSWHEVLCQTKTDERKLFYPAQLPGVQWRPMLRAARGEPDYTPANNVSHNHYREVHCDGLVELGFVANHQQPYSQLEKQPIFTDWPIVMLANLTIWADRVRKYAYASVMEYAVEVEIYTIGGTVPIQSSQVSVLGTLQKDSMKFPRYSLGNLDEVSTLLSLFRRDVWHYFGKDIVDDDTLEVKSLTRHI